jgi:hypothetical protein
LNYAHRAAGRMGHLMYSSKDFKKIVHKNAIKYKTQK